jgi:hypothetical protein
MPVRPSRAHVEVRHAFLSSTDCGAHSLAYTAGIRLDGTGVVVRGSWKLTVTRHFVAEASLVPPLAIGD